MTAGGPRASDAILAAAVRASPDGVIVADAEGRVLELNPAAEAAFGRRRAAVIGRPIGELITPPPPHDGHAPSMGRFLAGAAAGAAGGRRIETRAVRADGSTFPAELAIAEARADGRRLFALGLRDLTEQHAREEALRASEAFLRDLLDDQTDLVVRFDAGLRIVFCNKVTTRVFGVPPEAQVGTMMWDWILPEVWARLEGELRALTPAAPLLHGTDPKVMPSGEVRWFEWTNRAIFDGEGRVAGYQSVGRDITERRLAHLALAESEARLAAFTRNAPVGMYLKDLDGCYLLLNPEMGRVFGRPVAEMLGRGPEEVLAPDEAAMVRRFDAELLERGEPTRHEEHLEGHDAYAWSMVIRFPVRDASGRIVQIGGFDVDITGMKRAEEELTRSREALHQSEKLRAMGSLLAGVAHELNNPLAILVGQASMLEGEAGRGVLARRATMIRAAAERCARIVQTFVALARRKPPERRPVDLNEVARAALEIAGYGLRTTGVTVRADLAPGLPPLEADADQLHQVVLNLLINAQQALEAAPPPRTLAVRTARAGPDALVLEVADNGPGVPAEIRPRIFEPFFTTKPLGAGTGIGLSFSHGVAEAHQGRLELVDAGGGATFRLTLPVGAPPATVPAEPPRAAGSAAAARRTALIVDDEPEVAATLAELLVGDGHAVEVVLSGEAAQRLLAERDVDLVLCDLRMPGLDGPALFDWLRRTRPALAARTAFVTGDALGAGAAGLIARSGRPVLRKPFTRDAVRRVVAALGADGPA
jgi:PAS domain S-box-containing protein